MTFRERQIYHQIHLRKLFNDISALIISLYLLTNQRRDARDARRHE